MTRHEQSVQGDWRRLDVSKKHGRSLTWYLVVPSRESMARRVLCMIANHCREMAGLAYTPHQPVVLAKVQSAASPYDAQARLCALLLLCVRFQLWAAQVEQRCEVS